MLRGFLVEYNGISLSDNNGFEMSEEIESKKLSSDAVIHTTSFTSLSKDIEVKNIIITHPGMSIVEKWVELKNISDKNVKVTRIDSIRGILPSGKYRLKYFTSAWGKEYVPNDIKLEGTKILEVTTGRSSHGMHPWGALSSESGNILAFAIAWSGNWIVRFEPIMENQYLITGGLSNWNFSKLLSPGESMEGIHIIYDYHANGDLTDTSVEFGRWGRKYCYPQNHVFPSTLPVEWNTWWPYEDHKLNEDIVKANADEAAKIGIDVCTLDSGWFGTPVEGLNWYRIRGDWHKINKNRFPSGIRSLSDYIHNKGLKFGIWCEIEAAGNKAEVNTLHPEMLAQRDGNNLGYMCMGNPQTIEWAFHVAETLINEYGADWLKFDFNLDPGAGCNRSDHGHNEGDGLYEHYMGYYKLLDRIRNTYPGIIIENCSSGGLRIDLGILRRTHITHLSDPDYTENHLQVFWGATTMLHPSVCLHFTWSQSLYEQNIIKEPITEDMPVHKFDYYIRSAIMGVLGFSYRLPQFPSWCLQRLKQHIEFYKNIAVKFIKEADFYHLTEQAIRNGSGDRWNAYIYVTEDRKKALMFVFRLGGGEKDRVIRLRGLEKDTVYSICYKDSNLCFEKNSDELMEKGIVFDSIEEEGSEIVILEIKV